MYSIIWRQRWTDRRTYLHTTDERSRRNGTQKRKEENLFIHDTFVHKKSIVTTLWLASGGDAWTDRLEVLFFSLTEHINRYSCE